MLCGCVSGVAKGCERVNTFNVGDLKACKLLETSVVPKPIVRQQGSTSVSVTVERFFNQPPFDVLNPSRLTLLADFTTKEKAQCEDLPSIRAQKWGENHCVLRIRLSIPGVDHKTDDNYYYDDQTALESEFSMELFERADSVRFWVEVNVERNLELKQETVRFSSVLRSEAVLYNPVRSRPMLSATSPSESAANTTSG